MSFAIVASVASTVIGSALSSDSTSSATNTLSQADAEAARLAREEFEYQKEIQAPYQQAGRGALGMITNGLGIAPQVETREQIRARLSQGNTGTNTGVQQYSNPISSGNNPNYPYPSNIGNVSATLFDQFGRSATNTLSNLPTYVSDFYTNNTNVGREANAQQRAQRQQIAQALGLQGDNSPEASARINAYMQTMGANPNNVQQNNQLSGAELDRLVEEEYARQQQANASATGSAGFGDFNRDFTAADFDVNKDPSAKFRQDQANKALARTYAGSGNFFSGGALKGISEYNQEFASQEFGNAYNRFNADRDRRFNRLATVAGIGQTANTAAGNASQNYANTVGNNITDLGSARASAQLYGGRQLNNAVQSGFAQLGSAIPNVIPRIGNYFEQQRLSGYGGTTADPWYG